MATRMTCLIWLDYINYPGTESISNLPDHIVFHAGTTMKDGKVVTSGGRVMATVAMDTNLATAAQQARKAAEMVKFEGKFFRRDIAHKALKRYVVVLTLYMLIGLENYEYLFDYIDLIISTLAFIPHSWYHDCWWPGNARCNILASVPEGWRIGYSDTKLFSF